MVRTIILWCDCKIIAEALKQVFNTLFWGNFYAEIMLEQNNLENFVRNFPSSSPSPHILAYFSRQCQPEVIVQIVQRLRGELGWEGGFIAVMKSLESQKKLNQISIFGEKQAKFSYGNVAGHTALKEPLILAELLQKIEKMSTMSKEVWQDKLKETELGAIIAEVEKMADKFKSLENLQNVKNKIDQIDWHILVPHDKEPHLNLLLESLSSSLQSRPTETQWNAIILQIHRLLAMVGQL